MKKKIIIGILVLILLTLGVLCIIDHIRMNNNEEVLFSSWGKKYSAPLNEKEVSQKVISMYKTVIDDLIGKSKGILQGAEYISLDVDSFKKSNEENLTDTEKSELLDYCTKYHEEVKSLSLEGLRQIGLVEETDGFVSIDGVLIRILNIEKLTENKAVMEVQAFRTGLGAVMTKYELKYKNEKWNLKVKEIAIS